MQLHKIQVWYASMLGLREWAVHHNHGVALLSEKQYLHTDYTNVAALMCLLYITMNYT